MKRKIAVGLCASLLTLSLVGCSSTDEKAPETEAPAKTETEANASGLQDGTYEVETKEFDENGGKARATVVVKDGKIAEAKYNEFTEKGDKREDKGYNDMMKEKAGVSPVEYEVEIEKQIVTAQSPEIDGVSGATSSSVQAKSLFATALENAKEGKAEKELVTLAETAELQDGTYEVETKEFDENGGKARATVVVKDGKISEAKYNEFTEKGDKREDKGYNDMMKEQAGVSPVEYEVEIEKQVVAVQSSEIDGVSGATSSSAQAKTLFATALENAKEGKAEKALVEVK